MKNEFKEVIFAVSSVTEVEKSSHSLMLLVLLKMPKLEFVYNVVNVLYSYN
jgi:hypothetical protein